MQLKHWIYTALFLLALLISTAVFIRIRIGHIPTTEELKEIHHHTASEIYSIDGVLLGRYFTENRTNIQFEEIPKHFLDALISTEDQRFFDHTGVDYRSLARVFVKTLILQDKSAGGGSTLSQQLAKNLFPRKKSGAIALVAAKFREMIVATRLEEIYSKEELLTLYLNTVSFGENIYGLETAASRYFNKKPIALNVQEAAVLVGMLKANTAYNPKINPDQALTRRNTVLAQMARQNHFDEKTLDSITALPIELDYHRFTNERGTAPYFKALVRPMIDSILQTIKKPDGSLYNLDQDGLRITLPIHSKLQYYADSAVAWHLSELQRLFDKHWAYQKPWDEKPEILKYAVKHAKSELPKDASLDTRKPMNLYFADGPEDTVMSPMDSIMHSLMILQTGVLSMDPANGQIRAWVGGLDYEYFQFDHVLAKRQVGSTFKPLVYAAALENGIKPCDYFKNEKEVYKDYEDWSPGNANDEYEGFYSLKGALTNSVNTVSVQVIMETGIEKTIELAYAMGIKQKLPEVPSLALGTADLSLLEMVTAYSTLANGGIRKAPVFVLKIENAQGDTLWQNETEEGEQVLAKETTQLITNFMQSVVDQGTARSLRSRYGLQTEIAGKTGTTQSAADGWFIGFTPEIVTGVWVGADYPGIHFRTIQYGQGARMALPVWAHWMKQALSDQEFDHWNTVKFDSLSNELAQVVSCPLYQEKLTVFERIFGVKEEKEEDEKKSIFKGLKSIFKKKKNKE